MRRLPIGLALWLVLLAAAQVAAFWAAWRFFVHTGHGQLLDTVALTGNQFGRARLAGRVGLVLNAVSAVSLAVATTVVGFIALVRRRIALAVGAVLLIAGANLTTQLAKAVIDRPDLGIDPARAAAGNSLPSGHTAVAASVAVALVLVLPVRLRAAGALLGAVATAAVGVATLSAGWHRPSDAVAAQLIVGAWACAAALFVVAGQRGHGHVDYGRSHGLATVTLVLAGVALVIGAGLAMALTDRAPPVAPEELSRRRLLVAYAGGAMGIAGTAGLLLASVLATVHRVVPRMVSRSASVSPAAAAESGPAGPPRVSPKVTP
jgi:membrane-associated phospholipid phosphatase